MSDETGSCPPAIKGKNYSFVFIDDISKHSKNIIDLIEVGDYVNGEKIDFITNQKHLIIRDNINLFDKYKNIKSIVTHKQFESIEYEI